MTISFAVLFALFAGIVAGAAVMWFLAGRIKAELHEANARVAEMQRDSFFALANERFNAMVSPVQAKLTEFDALVREIEEKRVGAYEGLREQISGLIDRSGKMETAATNLSAALRNPTTRGKWGEIQLRRVVELAGMESYCDFGEQQTLDTGDERGRPDLTVQLPGNSRIFVDAKVPLNAFLEGDRIAGRSRADASVFARMPRRSRFTSTSSRAATISARNTRPTSS